MNIEILTIEGISYLSIQMENNKEKYLHLLKILEDNNCTLQRYYWRSIFDNNIIEYIEPKIYDCFNIVIDSYGKLDDLKLSIDQFKSIEHEIEKLPNLNNPLNETEIKELASRMIAKL